MSHKINYSDFKNTTSKTILASSTEDNKKLTLITKFGDIVSHYYEVSDLDNTYTTRRTFSNNFINRLSNDFNLAINYYNEL